ncbi:hypothetical protein HaLaN_25117, partial [Haematococcus lacustris]
MKWAGQKIQCCNAEAADHSTCHQQPTTTQPPHSNGAVHDTSETAGLLPWIHTMSKQLMGKQPSCPSLGQTGAADPVETNK